MVGLPNRVRTARFAPVNQIECFRLGLGPLVRQGQEIGWQAADHPTNHPVAGRFPSEIFGQSPDLPIKRCDRQRRLLHSKAFDGVPNLGRYRPVLATTRSFSSHQGRQTELVMQRYPSLGGPERHFRGRRDQPQWMVLLQMRLQQMEPI